jgi:hypothetical protein
MVCGVVLAWVLSPILSSRQTVTTTVAISWPGNHEDTAVADRYYKELVKEAHESARMALRSNQNRDKPPHSQGIGFSRPHNNRLEIFITTEDRRLSQAAVRETVAHMAEWTAEFPEGHPQLTTVNAAWDDLPNFPFGLAAAGAVLGLLAGWIIAASLPHE